LNPNAYATKGCGLPAYFDNQEATHKQDLLSNQVVSVNDLQEKMHWYQEQYEAHTSTLFCPAASQIAATGNVNILKNATGCSDLHLLVP
jgi:hypothetical protein